MSSLSLAVKNLVKDLKELNIRFAFVGALAMGARGRTRQTIDADLAISTGSNQLAEKLIEQLVLKGYGVNEIYKDGEIIALARLFSKDDYSSLIELDFLFELCGIEKEVVDSAEELEIWPGLTVAIATMPALLAMKARCQELPERIQDKADLVNQLIPFASESDLDQARELIKLIETRGFNEGRKILSAFNQLVEHVKKHK